MCHSSCINFGKKAIKAELIKGKSIIEVGSLNINGSLRPVVELFEPFEYIGVDIAMGPGVDQICPVENLISKFGSNRFDMIICTELLEHVKNWKKAIHNLKHILKPGGTLLVTTRSKGMLYHGYPFDFWRYEIPDFERIFSDFNIKVLEKDYEMPGIFFLGAKPLNFIENKFSNLKLYSILSEKRSPIIVANICWGLLNISLEILGLNKDSHYCGRILYYNKHPGIIFSWFTKRYLKGLLKPHQEKIIREVIDCLRLPYKNLKTWLRQIKSFLSYLRFNLQDTSNKKVSIIVPTLSKGLQADHLFKLKKLLSVYLPNQTHKNYEVIVYCDGPNDMVRRLVASLKDKRIKLYSTDNPLEKWGQPQTRLGVNLATGDFFVRVNDDNKPYRYYLQSLVSAFDCDTGIVYGRVIFKGAARKTHNLALCDSFVIPQDKTGELKYMNIDSFCYMVRMDLVKEHIESWDDTYTADWFFLAALLKNGVKYKFIDRIIGEKF
jgi:SAM-dependent methyltransferase